MGKRFENGARPASGRENRPINAIRITAAIIVVVGHARGLLFVDWVESSHDPGTTLFYAITSLGHQAVLVFFVLSGYWVGGSAWKRVNSGTFTWQKYLSDRLSRLWIVLIPALALTATVDTIGRSAFGSMSTYTNDPLYHHLADANPIDLKTFIGNALFLGGIRFPTFGSNGPLWSLSYEFWMYILGATAMLALSRPLGKRILWAVAFIVLIPIAGPEVLTYLPAWLLGVMVSHYARPIEAIIDKIPNRVLAFVQVFAVVSTLAISMFTHQHTEIPLWLRDYVVALFAAFLLASLSGGSHENRFSRGIEMRYANMARFSYSLYAIHLPLLVLFTSILGVDEPNRRRLSPEAFGEFLLIVAVMMIVAWLFYAVTEAHTERLRYFMQDRRVYLSQTIRLRVKVSRERRLARGGVEK